MLIRKRFTRYSSKYILKRFLHENNQTKLNSDFYLFIHRKVNLILLDFTKVLAINHFI